MNNAFVSIGMPVYNGEKYLKEALESLLAQTFENFELMISDNASTDGTEAICRHYANKDRRIVYIRQENNLGPTKNFEFLLKKARCKYFMWAAADDIWSNNWIERLLPIAHQTPCFAYGQLKSIDENGKPLNHLANTQDFNFRGSRRARRMKYFVSAPALGKANPIYGLFDKNLVSPEMIQIFHRREYGVDMLFMFELLKHAEIHCIQEAFLLKRIHSDSASESELTFQKSNFLIKMVNKAKQMKTYFLSYFHQASPTEIAEMIFLLPVAIFNMALARIRRI